jgi:triosephosphate isomerase
VKRKPYVAGNWKMNLDRRAAVSLATAVRTGLQGDAAVDVAVFPPFVYLEEVVRAVAGSGVAVGAQDVCDQPSGAFTGEVSAAMLLDIGAKVAIVGHSERRHVYGESEELCGRKLRAALAVGLEVILCVGETIEERQSQRTEKVVASQLSKGLVGVPANQLSKVTLAYEPVWAIGTGLNATAAQASEVHGYLRGLLSGLYSPAAADAMRIQYGGSVKPENARELLTARDVDGALVGGASLKPESFLAIVRYR